MSKQYFDIQKNITHVPDIKEEMDILLNDTSGNFSCQDVNDCEQSSRLLHSSGLLENFEYTYSNNLRNSIPNSSVVSHSNNLQRSPEIASFFNLSSNLRSSTPKVSSLLSPFESDSTKVTVECVSHLNNLQRTPEIASFSNLSSNLRSSTPKVSSLLSPFESDLTEVTVECISHSNNLQRTPEIASFGNFSSNLRSSTPKVSSFLTPFESEVTVECKNIDGQHTPMKNYEGFKANISNDIFEFQFDNNSSLPQKISNYSNSQDSSLNCIKLKSHNTENTAPISTYFSGKESQMATTNTEVPTEIDIALIGPNESPTISSNQLGVTGNGVKSLSSSNSCKRQDKLSTLHNSEGKYPDNVNKTCDGESLFDSYNIRSSDLISFHDELKCKPYFSFIDKINLINFSSDSDSKLFSSSYVTLRSTDEFITRESLSINSRYDETIYEIMHDILNQLDEKTSEICLPHYHTDTKKICSCTDESNICREFFYGTDKTEQLSENSEVVFIQSVTPNLNLLDSEIVGSSFEIKEETNAAKRNSDNINIENVINWREVSHFSDNTNDLRENSNVTTILNLNRFSSENLLDSLEINEEITQSKFRFENVNFENDFNCWSNFNYNKTHITECHTTFNLEEGTSGTVKTEDNATNTRQRRNENSFPDGFCKKMAALASNKFSSRLDICSENSKSESHPTELFFNNSKAETTTNKQKRGNSNISESSSNMAKLPIARWNPLKMDLGDDFEILNYNFKTLFGKDRNTFNLFSTPICKNQGGMLNFEVSNELRLLINRDSIPFIHFSLGHPVILSKSKLINNKSTKLDSNCSIYQPMKGANPETKSQDGLSKNSQISLKSDMPIPFTNIQSSTFKQSEIFSENWCSNINSKLYNIRQRPKQTKACEYVESSQDISLVSKMIFRPKEFKNISNGATFVPMHEGTLSSCSDMLEVSRFPESISQSFDNFSENFSKVTSLRLNLTARNDSSESFETDSSMMTNSDSENFIENYVKIPQRDKKLLPLQELFDTDKRVVKAVIQSFTKLGSSRGLKQSQIVKYINQQKILKTHSKLNRDIQNFLKVACELGIMRIKRFRYFLSERTSSLSKINKETKHKCKTLERRTELKTKSSTAKNIETRTASLKMATPARNKSGRDEFKVKTPVSSRIKGLKDTLDFVTPTRIKTRRSVSKMKTPASKRIKSKGDTIELKTPTRIKTRKVTFKVGTPASARISQSRKALSRSSNAKRQFLGDTVKSSIFCQTETEIKSPMVFKKLRSRVILKKTY